MSAAPPNVTATCRHIAKLNKPAATSFTLENGDGRAWNAAGECLGIITEIKVCKGCRYRRRYEGSWLYVNGVKVSSAGPPPRYAAKKFDGSDIGDWATEAECAAAIFALYPGLACDVYKAADTGERQLFGWKVGGLARLAAQPDFTISGPKFNAEIWKAAKA